MSRRRREEMHVLTRDGVVDAPVEVGSMEASTLGSYFNYVGQLLDADTIDDANRATDHLGLFDGVKVAGLELETDPDWIEYWARSGQLDIDDIYTD